MEQLSTGWLYLLQSGDSNHFKIGLTVRPVEKRIAQLSTGSPVDITLIKAWQVPTKQLKETEAAVHKEFGYRRIKLEWFTFDDAEQALGYVEGLLIVLRGTDNFK